MSGLRTGLIEDAADLRALAPNWWALWRRCPAATPFASPAWLLAWWDCFHPGPLRAAAVWAGETLVGLAPFYLENGPFGRRLLPLGMSVSDYLDVLIDPERCEAAGTALLDVLARSRDWDRLDAEELAPQAQALRLRLPPGWCESVAPQSLCPVLPLGGAELPIPAGKRRKLRMSRHRAERRGARIETAAAEDVAGLLDDLFRLHGARWQSRGEPGVLADERIRRFHASACPALLQAGLLRLHRIVIEGEVAGVYYGLADRGRAYAYLGGFDPAFSFESPGTLLIGQAIEDATLAGAHEFHFLRGQEAYKYEWGATDRPNSRRLMERGR